MPTTLLKNVLSNWGGMGLSILVAFAMTPYVIAKLGTNGYGFWALLQSLLSYMFLLEFGVRSSLMRHLAKFFALNDDRQINEVINTGLAVYISAGLLVAGLSCGLAAGFHRMFIVEETDLATIRWAVLLVGGSLALQFPSAVFESIMTGRQRFDLINVSIIISLLFRTGLTVGALETGYGVRGLAWATFLAGALLLAVNYRFARRLFPALQLQLSAANRSTLRLLGRHSFYAFIMIGAARFLTDAGNVIVGVFLGTSMVSFYAVASSLTNYVFGVVSGISTTISPLASAYDAQGNQEGLQALCLTGTKTILLVGLPILATFVLAGEMFLKLWVGEGMIGSYPPLIFLSVAWGMNLLSLSSSCVLIGVSRHQTAAWCVLGQAVLDVGCSLALVRDYGVVGVAVGAMIAASIMNLVLQLHALRVLGIPVRMFVQQALAPAILSVVPFVLMLALVMRTLPPTGMVGFFVCVTLAVGFFLLLLPVIGLNSVERAYVKDRASEYWRQVAGVVKKGGSGEA